MIERYTKEQVSDFAERVEDGIVFILGKDGDWGVGICGGRLTKSGRIMFSSAYDIDRDGDSITHFGNGDRGYSAYWKQVIAMFPESESEAAKAFFAEMTRIEETYRDDCKAPLLKMQTSIAVLQARINP